MRIAILTDPLSSGDFAAIAEDKSLETVVFAGIRQPDPIHWITEVRSQGVHDLPRIILLSSPTEIRTTQMPQYAQRLSEALSRNGANSAAPARRIEIDQPGRVIRHNGRQTTCGPLELRLLLLFIRYPGVLFSRNELLRRIRSAESPVDPRIIDVVVRSLRKKIEVDPAAPAHVRTVQGVGYFFVHHSGVFWDTLTNRPLLPWPR